MSRGVVRREAGWLAQLLGVCVVAITQPVLDVFGDTPEQFVFRGASTSDIVLFPVLVALVPAVVLWLPGMVTRLAHERAGRILHLAAIGLALYVALLQVVGSLIDATGVTKAVLSGLVAGAGVWLLSRFEAARMWTQMMAMAAMVFVGLFLFASPTGDLAFGEPPEVVELDAGPVPSGPDTATTPTDEGRRFPDIVMVVLDSLPTSVLLDQSGAIDRLRYPALADFADDATWYRRYTTINDKTARAIPAILSGRMPEASGNPAWTTYPDTLFRLLGGTYHLTVSESATRLCPEDWCGRSPIPPPPPFAGDPATTTEAPTTTTTVAPDTADSTELDRGGISRLIGDAVDVWRDQIALDPDSRPVLSGFEEAFESAPEPAGPSTTTSTTTPLTALETPSNADESVIDLRPGFEGRFSQLPRFESFVEAIGPSSDPALYYLHVVLPHSPFIFTEQGRVYDSPPFDTMTEARWESRVLRQRTALQMQFTDRLVGDLLDSLRAQELYDDALIVIVSDHSSGLDDTKFYRYYDGTNAPALMVTPLLIKAPRQTVGTISEAPIEATDVLPTLADMLDIEVPWEMDGSSALDRDPNYVDPACDDVRRFVRFGQELVGDDSVANYEFCANDVVPAGLEPTLGELRPDDEWATAGLARFTPFEDLLGRPWDELGAFPGGTTVTLELAEQTLEGAERPVGVVAGTVDGAIAAEWVAVAIDGRVAGISAIYDRRVHASVVELVEDTGLATDAADDQFAVIVPTQLMHTDGYDVRVAALETLGGDVVATELGIANR